MILKALYCASNHNVRLGNTPETHVDEEKAIAVADLTNRVVWVQKFRDKTLTGPVVMVPFESITCADLQEAPSDIQQALEARAAEILQLAVPKAGRKAKSA